LRLLSREHPAQAAFEIELFHVEDEPRIVRAGGASEKNPPQIRALGFVRSHRCVGCAVTIRTPRKASDEAVVRFAYLAPEIIRRISTDLRVDMFALGVTAYELFTNQLPWEKAASFDTLRKHINNPGRDPRHQRALP